MKKTLSTICRWMHTRDMGKPEHGLKTQHQSLQSSLAMSICLKVK